MSTPPAFQIWHRDWAKRLTDAKPVISVGKYPFAADFIPDAEFEAMQDAMVRATNAMAEQIAIAADDEIRRMLGEWVSELEPTLVCRPADFPNNMLGLAWRGDPYNVIVPARLRIVIDGFERPPR